MPWWQQVPTTMNATLATLRDRHAAWRLLASPHAPRVAIFLRRVFVGPKVRPMAMRPNRLQAP